ncbi:MAG: oxaloacetate decarboxylase [Legionellales bacterium]|nr:oxaloacetate decarboxylase [Legionellales bacterium]
MKKTTQLRQYINSNEILICPGVFDGLSARLVEQAGFRCIYASGGAIARSAGFPDLGLLSFSEITTRLEHMAEVTTLPIIADADTGYGNSLNVDRTVKMYEKIGLAGLHIEDQEFPKRCGHLDDKKLIPQEEMVKKIKAARNALSDPDFVIIARTDAIAAENFDNAITRSQAYLAAGADMIFVEAPQSVEQIELIAKHIPQPKLINMFHGGKTPLVPAAQLQALGYRVVIIPSDLQRAAIHAMQTTLQTILRDGDSHAIADQLTSFNEREIIIDTKKFLDLDKA